MSNDSIVIKHDDSKVLCYSVKRGETVFALCRDVKDANAVKESLEKRKDSLPYE